MEPKVDNNMKKCITYALSPKMVSDPAYGKDWLINWLIDWLISTDCFHASWKGKRSLWILQDRTWLELIDELEVIGSECIRILLLIMHECTVMIHNTCVTVLTKEEEILKTVESSWFRKALIWYTESAWRLVIRCCLFILVITIKPEVVCFVHVYLAEMSVP